MLYIQGGFSRFNNKKYTPCNDKSAPLEDKHINIPYKLYFGNNSGSWEGGGVAFLEPKRNDNINTLGKMFLITEEQFNDINEQESSIWYNLIIDLGTLNGVAIKTFTHSDMFTRNLPVQRYLKVIEEGISETYPELSKNEIENYLKLSINTL
ncbi:MAG TPA: hypothetical protein VIM70_15935 [Clostridium sp.]|uniref:hypothetical protein n=1 Tax=Clostridium sp. TaxID=1506 RepID=UPI002F948298